MHLTVLRMTRVCCFLRQGRSNTHFSCIIRMQTVLLSVLLNYCSDTVSKILQKQCTYSQESYQQLSAVEPFQLPPSANIQNALPDNVVSASSLDSFWHRLNTVLTFQLQSFCCYGNIVDFAVMVFCLDFFGGYCIKTH